HSPGLNARGRPRFLRRSIRWLIPAPVGVPVWPVRVRSDARTTAPASGSAGTPAAPAAPADPPALLPLRTAAAARPEPGCVKSRLAPVSADKLPAAPDVRLPPHPVMLPDRASGARPSGEGSQKSHPVAGRCQPKNLLGAEFPPANRQADRIPFLPRSRSRRKIREQR